MASLSSLSTATTTVSAASNLILVTPSATVGYQPFGNIPGYTNITQQVGESGYFGTFQAPDGTILYNVPLPPAFAFHYEGEQTVTLDSDITDHYVEDNSAIQDQISLKPVIITTQGFIGELNDVAPIGLQTLYQATQSLTSIGAYSPQLSITAQEAYNEAFQLYQIALNAATAAYSAVSSIASSITGSVAGGISGQNVVSGNQTIGNSITLGSPIQTKQQNAFQQFYTWWSNRVLFLVQTPWAVFDNMAIKTLKPVQSAETNVITTFEITFKQIRTATTAITTSNTLPQGRLSSQSATVSNQGVSAPASSISLEDGLSAGFPSMFA